jgi:hypothetical protein
VFITHLFVKNAIGILLILQLIGLSGFAQDTINFLSGKRLVVGGISFDDPLVIYSGAYNNKGVLKNKPGNLDYYRIFSVSGADGKETILYRTDTLLGQDRNETEARYFAYGGQHAYKYVKPYWQMAAAGGASLFLSMLDTYNNEAYTLINGTVVEKGLFRSEPSVLQVAIPFIATAAFGFTRVKLKSSQVRDRALLNDENFLLGYKRVARQKIVFNSLKGSLMGVAVGLVGYAIFKS